MKSYMHFPHNRGIAIAACSAAFIASILLAGCGQTSRNLPPLHPAHGRVQYKDGRPVPAGEVSFVSQSNPLVTCSGAISNGTFTLSSFMDREIRPGAPPGLHRVQIDPPPAEANPLFPCTTLPTPLEVKPGDNNFTLTVDKPAARE